MEQSRPALARVPAESLFVLGAVSQYVGAALAVLLFDAVPAAGVAWLRVVSAAAALAAWRRPWRHSWAGESLRLVVLFGSALALMNLSFYLAIDRLPLGTAVSIEFVGPIAVAAAGSRTGRDWTALGLGATGMILLADAHISGSPAGIGFALGAAAFWATYIVLGHRIARRGLGVNGLALGMCAGVVAIAPIGLPESVPALTDPALLVACIGVGLCSSVIPYVLDQVALRRLDRARFALLLCLLPLTATVTGAAVLDQRPSPLELTGIAVVVAAVALARGRGPGPADELETGG